MLYDDLLQFKKDSSTRGESKIDLIQKENSKANASLLKMVIAMAIDGYGYDPNDKKSPIPAQLVNYVEQRGLSIDVDTVRKWLKEAAELLPPKENNPD